MERILWCFKAASSIGPSLHRTRLLTTIASLLFPPAAPHAFTSPRELQTLVNSLLILVRACSNPPTVEADVTQLQALISRLWEGECGELTGLDEEYDIAVTSRDVDADLRSAILVEGAIRSLRSGSENHQKWVLKRLFEVGWII